MLVFITICLHNCQDYIISHCFDKIIKAVKGKQIYFGLRFEGIQSIMTGKACEQEGETVNRKWGLALGPHFLCGTPTLALPTAGDQCSSYLKLGETSIRTTAE